MTWKTQLNADPLPWLLEADQSGVRHRVLQDLLDVPPADKDLLAARREAHVNGPIATVLSHMQPEGYWEKPGAGYGPKYFSTVWSIILLAQLGARVEEDARILKACQYLVDHALTPGGHFSASSGASGSVDCLQGNLSWSLLELGFDDPRLDKAFEMMARTLTGEGVAPKTDKQAPVRYYAGKCGPGFACGANLNLPCAWGAAKVMLAFGSLPKPRRTPLIDKAIRQGVDFLFSVDPADATWPSGYTGKPSGNWWKFGFPIFYITDLLQVVEALVRLGCANDPRLIRALEIIQQKQDANGRWALEYDYAGKTWVGFGSKKQPSKWVTLRALRVLKAVSPG